MKKIFAVFALSACMLALSACGGKGENVETGAAATNASGENASNKYTVVELPDEYEPEYVEGIITALDDNCVTVEDEDGNSQVYDITNAERFEDEYVLTGSLVELEYAVVEGDIYPAAYISVLMDIEEQADDEGRDPVIYGTLQHVDVNDIIMLDETGTERTFDNQMSRTVSFSELKAGSEIAVTYIGTIFGYEEDDDDYGLDHPVAVKIVSLDALGSDEAETDYITGEVYGLYSDGVMLVMTEPIVFEVLVDESMVEDIEEDDKVRVYYEGSIGGINFKAKKVEPAE